jgi:glycosyltransferase involved in cell wall biosynthesis
MPFSKFGKPGKALGKQIEFQLIQMAESEKLRVLLASPKPPPTGGIAHWTRIVEDNLGNRPDLELHVLNTALRFRSPMNLSKTARIISGLMQLFVDGYRLLVAMRKIRPHVFHLCTSGSLGTARDFVVLMIAKCFGVPGVIHFHMGQLPRIYEERGLAWKFARRSMSLAVTVVTLYSGSEGIVRAELPDVRSVTLPNPVQMDALDDVRRGARKALEPANAYHIVFVGMVTPAKGVRELVQACLKMSDRNFKLTIVGPIVKGFREELNSLASQNGPAEWLQFTGLLDHKQSSEYIASADIFTLPSHTEGAPNVILEAMSLERCIVATSVGAIPEMLDIDGPEKCGVCVPPFDADRLAQAILELLDQPELRKEMGIKAYQRAKRLYDAPVVCSQLAKLWADAAWRK